MDDAKERDNEVRVRLTDDEKRLIDAASRIDGERIAAWARRQLVRVARRALRGGRPMKVLRLKSRAMPLVRAASDDGRPAKRSVVDYIGLSAKAYLRQLDAMTPDARCFRCADLNPYVRAYHVRREVEFLCRRCACEAGVLFECRHCGDVLETKAEACAECAAILRKSGDKR